MTRQPGIILPSENRETEPSRNRHEMTFKQNISVGMYRKSRMVYAEKSAEAIWLFALRNSMADNRILMNNLPEPVQIDLDYGTDTVVHDIGRIAGCVDLVGAGDKFSLFCGGRTARPPGESACD